MEIDAKYSSLLEQYCKRKSTLIMNQFFCLSKNSNKYFLQDELNIIVQNFKLKRLHPHVSNNIFVKFKTLDNIIFEYLPSKFQIIFLQHSTFSLILFLNVFKQNEMIFYYISLISFQMYCF